MNDEDTRKTAGQLRSELARARQQVADMAAAQEDFLRAVSHDLRAPLRHFTSYGKLVRETLGDLPPAVAQGDQVQEVLGFLATMDQSARRMGLMIDGLQALARAGRAPLRLQPVPLADAVARAQEALAGGGAVQFAASSPQPVQWRMAAGLPALQADPELLHELLVQLLGNAVKFTRKGPQPAHISVAAAAADAPGQVAFTLTDNGVGFDGARAGQLFGVFQRLHRDTEFDGVGAGLAVCRAIAQRHGASISAVGQVGAGCTVRVQWPEALPCALEGG